MIVPGTLDWSESRTKTEEGFPSIRLQDRNPLQKVRNRVFSQKDECDPKHLRIHLARALIRMWLLRGA